jgi:hypothetical protein
MNPFPPKTPSSDATKHYGAHITSISARHCLRVNEPVARHAAGLRARGPLAVARAARPGHELGVARAPPCKRYKLNVKARFETRISLDLIGSTVETRRLSRYGYTALNLYSPTTPCAPTPRTRSTRPRTSPRRRGR